jgi:hypothetical protein
MPDRFEKVPFALGKLGFRERDVRRALRDLRAEQGDLQAEPLLRAALNRLTPALT